MCELMHLVTTREMVQRKSFPKQRDKEAQVDVPHIQDEGQRSR